MTTLLTVALVALALALLAVREPTVDARTPAQLRDAAATAGRGRTALTVARVALVVALLVLVEAFRLAGHLAAAAVWVLAALATVAALAGGRPLTHGRAA